MEIVQIPTAYIIRNSRRIIKDLEKGQPLYTSQFTSVVSAFISAAQERMKLVYTSPAKVIYFWQGYQKLSFDTDHSFTDALYFFLSFRVYFEMIR